MSTPRLTLPLKVLLLCLMNLLLLAVVLTAIARVELRLDAGAFLLAPAQGRMQQMADELSRELDGAAPDRRDAILQRAGAAHGVACYLLDEEGRRVAGPELQAPQELWERLPRRSRPGRPEESPDRKPGERAPLRPQGEPRAPAPPLFLTTTTDPLRFWAGVRIPLRENPTEEPRPATLILTSTSLFDSSLFFDPRPWLLVMLAIVLVTVACWLPFIRGLTHSVAELTRAAGMVAEGRFAVQVETRRRDEVGQLGEAVNRMAARLAGYVNGQKRFLGGIAHELCTPIATIQFGLGNLERRVGEEQRELVADIQEEIEHMSDLVNELLQFSRAGIVGHDTRLVPAGVAEIVGRAVAREAPPAQAMEVSIESGLTAMADPEYLFRAVSNLIRNAVRYAGHAGPITVTGRAAGERVLLVIADQGPGVPAESLDEIFAPFYRLDDSRDQATGGVGLGLAIVKTCVEACQGVVRCRNRKSGGLEVEIELQRAGQPAEG